MSTLNLDMPNVIEKGATVEEIREGSDEFHERVEGWLDEAQGKVFGGEHPKAWLVIEVTLGAKQEQDPATAENKAAE